MNNLLPALPLIVGFLLDACVGDPYNLPHPIRLIGKMIAALELLIKTNVWGSKDAAPADWVDKMCLYSATGEPGDLSYSARNWIDKHLCPWYQRGWASRRDSGKMSKFTLD
jgi:hypothetical protein